MLAILCLAACDDAGSQSAATPAGQSALASQARQAAQGKLGSELRGALSFEAVRVFPQAAEDTVAVCGQVAMAGAAQPVPFVSLVSRQPDGTLAVEQHVATGSVSATRVYVETQARCVADAATAPPAAPRRGAPPPLPAIPANLATLAPAASPAVLAQEAAQAEVQSAAGIIMRQPGNLRQSPSGGGAVLRVLPRGTTMRVFAEAPGGWLQIGAQEAEGWVHASMVSRDSVPRVVTASR